MDENKRLWTHEKLRTWMKSVNQTAPKGTLIAPLTDGDGCYLVTYQKAGYAQPLVFAVRRAGGFAKVTYVDLTIGWESVEIDMHNTVIDRYENSQLSLRLEGDV